MTCPNKHKFWDNLPDPLIPVQFTSEYICAQETEEWQKKLKELVVSEFIKQIPVFFCAGVPSFGETLPMLQVPNYFLLDQMQQQHQQSSESVEPNLQTVEPSQSSQVNVQPPSQTSISSISQPNFNVDEFFN